MSSEARKRLRQDLKMVMDDPPTGVVARMSDDSLFEWDVTIDGPGRTCYEGGTFQLKLKFPDDYPQKPPKACFSSQMFHPNVYKDGKICLDILEVEERWKPDYDAYNILLGIQALLGAPNPNSPANAEATHYYETDRKEYERRVLEIVCLSLDKNGSNTEN